MDRENGRKISYSRFGTTDLDGQQARAEYCKSALHIKLLRIWERSQVDIFVFMIIPIKSGLWVERRVFHPEALHDLREYKADTWFRYVANYCEIVFILLLITVIIIIEIIMIIMTTTFILIIMVIPCHLIRYLFRYKRPSINS